MSFSEIPLASRDVDARILSLLHKHRFLTFTEMADALPEYKWSELLNALIRLHAREIVTLSALRLDYAVKLRKGKSRFFGRSDSVGSTGVSNTDPVGPDPLPSVLLGAVWGTVQEG